MTALVEPAPADAHDALVEPGPADADDAGSAVAVNSMAALLEAAPS